MKRLLPILLFSISVSLLLSNCSTGPDFERDNVNDPLSVEFIPDISDFTITVNPDKTVSLKWNDNSKHETGFLISKSFNSDTSFSVIDSLPANSNSYTDGSKQLAVETYYKISANIASERQNNLPGVTKKLTYGNSLDFKVNTVGSKVKLTWNTKDNFFDKVKIEKKIDSEWLGIYESESDDSVFIYEESSKGFLIDLRISSFLYTNDKSYSLLETNSLQNIQFNYPTDVSIEVLSEALIKFNWVDQTPFNDEFILLQEMVNEEEVPTFTPIDTVKTSGSEVFIHYNPDKNYKFSLIPIFDGKRGTPLAPITKQILVRKPELASYTSISESKLSITWKDNNINYSPSNNEFPTYKFYLFIYDELGNIIRSIEKEPDEETHIFSNLNPNEFYTICIRSYSSPCLNKAFKNTAHASLKEVVYNNADYSHFEFSENNLLYVVPEWYQRNNHKTLEVFDGLSGKILDTYVFDYEFSTYSTSPNERLIALINEEAKINEETTKIIDVSTNPYQLVNKNKLTSRGIFYDDSTMVLGTEHSIYFLNVYTNKLTLKGTIQNQMSDYYISNVYTNKYVGEEKSIFFEYVSKFTGNSIFYHFNPRDNKFTIFNANSQVFGGFNGKGEGLLIRSIHEKPPKIFKINTEGKIISEYNFPFKPSLLSQYVRGGSYVQGGFIVTYTSNGFIHVFDENSEQYLSSTRFTTPGDINLGANLPSSRLIGSYSEKKFLFYFKGEFKIYEIESSWTEKFYKTTPLSTWE